MTDYIRRIVSGNKARFKDHNLNLELDLVYVTDQVIIMGYPASGIEGLYRNRREDARRFLEHRHGKNYWVFNFCPIKENSYDADVFEGRVSRYPFPDHHAPPLAIMPLLAREMHAWLKGSPDRVAVLHCKAGKGRSGTMACTYLLSLNDNPIPPQLERSYAAKEWAKRRMETTLNTLPPDEEQQQPTSSINPLSSVQEDNMISPVTDGILDVEVKSASLPPPEVPNPEKSFTDALKGVLDLHTSRRMKPSEKDDKVKQGVSIPSQRRFLYYWSLLLAHEASKHLWTVDSPQAKDDGQKAPPFKRSKVPCPKVRLTELKLRMRETSGMKINIVKAANLVIEKTNMAKGPSAATGDSKSKEKERTPSPSSPSQVWASLARYDDGLVDMLEEWEVYTRDLDGHMGKRRHGSEHRVRGESGGEEDLNQIFGNGNGKWDKGKMVRSFAHLGVMNGAEIGVGKVDDKEGKIRIYTLRPLSDKRWEGLKHDLHKEAASDDHENSQILQVIDSHANVVGVSLSEANSMYDVTSTADLKKHGVITNMASGLGLEHGVILDAGREVRVKLYMGQVFMGWFWFVPTFHMPQSPSNSSSVPSPVKATFVLTRKDLDFPLGIGSSIIDVEVKMEWVVSPSPSSSAHPLGDNSALFDLEPPLRARTEDSEVGTELEPEPAGLAAAVQVALGGGEGEDGGAEGLRDVVEAKQGGVD